MVFQNLFWAVILYDLLNRILHKLIRKSIKREIMQFAILILLLIFGWLGKIYLDDPWGNIFSTMILLDIGRFIKKILERYNWLSEINFFYWISIFILAFLVIFKMSIYKIELSCNQIVNPIIFISGALIGFIMLYSIYMLIIIQCEFIRTLLVYIGRNSVWIITLHLFAFRIVAWIQIKYYDLPMENISYPFCPINKPYWWILYLIVGITIPLICKICYNFFKNRIKRSYSLKKMSC